ncbi:MAG TPA: hypothetical protein VIG80_09375 [Bacillaceae bacterium]
MGYIAPIPHYQYQQYSDRVQVEPKGQDPFPVTSIHKVDLRSKFRRTLEERIHEAHKDHVSYWKGKGSRYQKMSVQPEILSEITGKGKHFNEYV